MSTKLIAQALVLIFSTIVSQPIVTAAEAVTPAMMVQILRNSNVLKPNVALRATYDDHVKRAIVLTDRVAKATDEDCKIDAVLVAKKLMDTYPDEITGVRLIFNPPGGGDAQQVDVSKIEVKAYASGAVKASELLAALSLVPVNPEGPGSLSTMESNVSVAPGPFMDQRLILLGNIEKLRKGGTGVTAFQTLFNKIETEAKLNDEPGLRKDIPYLSEKLKEQENLVLQAAKTAAQKPPDRQPQQSMDSRGHSSPPGGIRASSDLADVNTRCDRWMEKLREWKAQNMDTSEMEAAIMQVRMLANMPGGAAMAKQALDQMDAVRANPHPLR